MVGSNQSNPLRVIVLAAVKNDLALIAVAAGPFREFTPHLRAGTAVTGQPADRPGHGQVRQQLLLAGRPAALSLLAAAFVPASRSRTDREFSRIAIRRRSDDGRGANSGALGRFGWLPGSVWRSGECPSGSGLGMLGWWLSQSRAGTVDWTPGRRWRAAPGHPRSATSSWFPSPNYPDPSVPGVRVDVARELRARLDGLTLRDARTAGPPTAVAAPARQR